MEVSQVSTLMQQDEKTKVAYALNLCAVSISQIIGSKDLVVLKQERESILNNLNLQNFVKHPALLDALKRILDTITYLEIQAGDLSFIEDDYQNNLKNAIWSAVPSPGAFLAGGDPVSIALAVAAQIGTGYMNYRRNKSQYARDKDKSTWELRKHELEQLYGLRAQLFEAAWMLSADFDFDDRFRLTEKQLSRLSEALLEEDALKRFERLDVMSEKFAAFPPFWYYKGNAAMEIYRDSEKKEEERKYGAFSSAYKDEALKAYSAFHASHFEFLREDIVAASCCVEHISLLDPSSERAQIDELLQKALRLAGDNYDVLQQIVLVNLRQGNFEAVIAPLREMIANEYNVGLNGMLLTQIYNNAGKKLEFEKLKIIAGADKIGEWGQKADDFQKNLREKQVTQMSKALDAMLDRLLKLLTLNKLNSDIYAEFDGIMRKLKLQCSKNEEFVQQLETLRIGFRNVIGGANQGQILILRSQRQKVVVALKQTQLSPEMEDEALKLPGEMDKVARNS